MPMSPAQEKAIISEVRSGDPEQYRALVERYHRGLIQHLYNLLHDGSQAEDVAQEAFIRAYQKLDQYDEQFAFSTWLYKIADNLAFRYLKQAKHVSLDTVADVLPDNAPSVADKVDREFTKDAVRRALDCLPIGYRQVIVLYYWDECSYEDIATIMERPIGTIRTWLFRAKEELRKELYGQV
jgi:RNA polymerase sigma-70 factor (ECF subfamily)